jgi:putative transposase
MARPLRIEYPGAVYHVTSRGNAQQDIVHDDGDRSTFFDVLKSARNRFNVVIHAYCLMDNHYHLLVETPDANLSKFMRHLNGVYTQRYNADYCQNGHLFQGRYKAILVQRDLYLSELARYIVLNPVRAGMVKAAKDWRWSSYRATAGLSEGFSWLSSDWLLSTFAVKKSEAVRLYRRFVSDGKKQAKPWINLKNQIYFGDQEFVDKMRKQVSKGKNLSEIPSSQKRGKVKTLSEYEEKSKNRNMAICKAYASGGYSMKQVGDYFKLHYSWVSRIVSDAKSKT